MNVEIATYRISSTERDTCAEVLWNYAHLGEKPSAPADTMLILCSSDHRPADYAADLYHQGQVKRIIVSGGKGRVTRNQVGPPEARAFASQLRKRHVPTRDIIIEDKSTNSGDNFRKTYTLLRRRREQLGSVVLAQQPVSERRALYTFKKQWPGFAHGDDVEIMATNSYHTSFHDYLREVGADHAAEKLVGEILRIKEYPKRGFTVEPEEPIPHEVLAACYTLIAAGYTKYANLE